MSDPSAKPPRRIACVRCRRTKKKCDHSVPICGQCRRAGVECRQFRTHRTGDLITVPVSYFQHLEAKANATELDPAAPSPPHSQNTATQEDVPGQAWSSPPNPLIPPTPPSVDGGGRRAHDSGTTWFESLGDQTGGAGGITHDEADGLIRATPGQAWDPPSMSSTHQESPGLFSENHGLLGSSSDALPVQDAGLDMTWSVELYANIYLAHVHKMYPFLHEASIRRWMRTCSRGHALEGDHKGFILRILCAIGAYMCSSFGETCPHLKEATSLSQQAFTSFHSGAMKKSPVIRAQVCLLALFHAIYGPRSESIHETLASALTECARVPANASHDSAVETPPSAAAPGDQTILGQQEDTADYEDLRRNIIFSCHQVNEIIACGWDRSQEDVLRSFDDELSICIDRLSASQACDWTHLRPYHKMRKIQHKIRLFHDAFGRWGLYREAKNKWKADIVQDVEDWRANLPQTRDEGGPGAYAPSSMCYTQKLYDYTICLLHEVDPSSMGIEDLHALLEASSDACRKYRVAQASSKGIMLRNWNTLVYQFRAGVLVLYCMWATPVSLRTPAYRSAETTVADCSDTLSDFASRWPLARVFHEAFMCLAAQTPLDSSSATAVGFSFPQEEAARMEGLISRLRALRVHKSVLSVIEAIIHWPPGLMDLEDENMNQLLAVGLDSMNFFGLGQNAYGADLFSLPI